jgi:hypothetical protein
LKTLTFLIVEWLISDQQFEQARLNASNNSQLVADTGG